MIIFLFLKQLWSILAVLTLLVPQFYQQQWHSNLISINFSFLDKKKTRKIAARMIYAPKYMRLNQQTAFRLQVCNDTLSQNWERWTKRRTRRDWRERERIKHTHYESNKNYIHIKIYFIHSSVKQKCEKKWQWKKWLKTIIYVLLLKPKTTTTLHHYYRKRIKFACSVFYCIENLFAFCFSSCEQYLVLLSAFLGRLVRARNQTLAWFVVNFIITE